MRYNVRVSVVDVVDADDPVLADLDLRNRLSRAGFDPFVDDDFEVFESDD